MENLLILGAGQYGTVVKEIAAELGRFERIAFLDDAHGQERPHGQEKTIGTLADLDQFALEYSCAIPALGNPDLRLRMLEALQRAGFTIPVLVSPRAYVSPSALLEQGVVVEPLAGIQARAKVGTVSYVSMGAVIHHNAEVASGCHIDCNAVVMPGVVLRPKTTTRPGEVLERNAEAPSHEKQEARVKQYIRDFEAEPSFF